MKSLWLVPSGGEPIRIDKDQAAVGRDASAAVVISHQSVSRKHAVIEWTGEGWMVADQKSGNGTWLDGQRVIRAMLREGQNLRFGAVSFTVRLEQPAPRRDEPAIETPAESASGSPPVTAAELQERTSLPAPSLPPAPPTPAPAIGIMSAAEAAEILGVAPGTPAHEVRKKYQKIYNDLQIRLTNAPTASLKRMYQKNLQNLKAAAEALAPGVLSGP